LLSAGAVAERRDRREARFEARRASPKYTTKPPFNDMKFWSYSATLLSGH
jgi:hypothetical protein